MSNTETVTEKKKLTKQDFYNTIFEAKGKEAKKELLKDLSNTAKLMLELNPEAGTNVNDVIVNKMYKNEEHQEFSTFKGWLEKGFQVKKGSKSFFIWSKPRNANKKDEAKKDDSKDKDEYKFFGIAYLFSNAQVEEIKA